MPAARIVAVFGATGLQGQLINSVYVLLLKWNHD
jgi:hypothetical protein